MNEKNKDGPHPTHPAHWKEATQPDQDNTADNTTYLFLQHLNRKNKYSHRLYNPVSIDAGIIAS